MDAINATTLEERNFSLFLPNIGHGTTNKVRCGIYNAVREVLIDQCSYLVPRGWQCHIGINTKDGISDNTAVCEYLYKYGNAGSYATAKYKTLEEGHSTTSTGGWTVTDLRNIMQSSSDVVGFSQFMDRLDHLENLEQLSKADKEWLRDSCNLSTMYGAIEVPFYVGSLARTSEVAEEFEFGMIISMSGAKESLHDEYLAVRIFKNLKETIVRIFDACAVRFDTTTLSWDKNLRLWLDVLDIPYQTEPVAP